MNGKELGFMYDDFSDRLMVTCKGKGNGGIVVGSARFMNLTLDFDSGNKVVGAEIRGISKMLDSLEIDSNILNKLTSAELVFRQVRGGYLIYFLLKSKDRVERIPFNVPVNNAILH